MQEKEAKITIYDEKGSKVSVKPISKFNRKKDIVRSVNVFIVFDDLVLLMRAEKSIWDKSLWGSPTGIVQEGEKPLEAAQRLLDEGFGIKAKAKSLGEKYYDFDGIKRFMSVFVVKIKDDVHPIVKDWRWFNLDQAKKLSKTDQCVPTFAAAWKVFEKSKKN